MNEPTKSDNLVQLRIRDFEGQILFFNGMYGLPISKLPRMQTVHRDEIRKNPAFENAGFVAIENRLLSFKATLLKEVNEVDDIVKSLHAGASELEMLTDLADWLGDIMIYCASEMAKFGIPQKEVLRIIMQSNFSKLQADGSVKYDEHGKVEKGPGYWKPEPLIRDLLLSIIEEHKT